MPTEGASGVYNMDVRPICSLFPIAGSTIQFQIDKIAEYGNRSNFYNQGGGGGLENIQLAGSS